MIEEPPMTNEPDLSGGVHPAVRSILRRWAVGEAVPLEEVVAALTELGYPAMPTTDPGAVDALEEFTGLDRSEIERLTGWTLS